MAVQTIEIDRLADIMLSGMGEPHRTKVLDAVGQLLGAEPEDWPEDTVTYVGGSESEYMVRVPPDLCAFVRPEGNVLLLSDVILEEARRFFAGKFRNGTEE